MGLSAGVLAATAASASGATTIGSELTALPTGSFASANLTLVQPVAAGRSFVSPIDGVIVRWRVLNPAGTTRPRVMSSTDSGATFVGVRSGPTGTATASGPTPFPVSPGLSINAGQYFAIDQVTSFAISENTSPPPGTVFGIFNPTLADGGPATAPTGTAAQELLVNADVERDRDGDKFGDETQDACPNQAGTHANPCGSVSISSATPLKKGKVTVTAMVPGAGTLTGGAASDKGLAASAAKKKLAPMKEAQASRTDFAPGPITVTLAPAKPTKQKLAREGKLKMLLKLVYTPKDGGAAVSTTTRVKLKA